MRHKFTVVGLILALVFAFSTLVLGQKHYKDLKYPKLREVTIPEPIQITLDNGMKVFLLEDHELPFISMRAQFVAGSAWEPAEKVGLAGITGSVMRTGGSTTMPGDQMDEELESIAAEVETWIATLYGGAYMFTLKDHFDKVFAIFADVLLHPAFPDDKIELARVEARSAISRRNDQVTQIAQREFNQLIYGEDSPYYRDTEYATIDAITREDIVDFHKKSVQPNGMIFGVWGDFKVKDMIKKIRATFKTWAPAGSAEILPPKVDYEFNKTVNLIKKTDINQSNIYIGHLGGKKDNPDNAALIMMNEVLSGGFASRLFSRVRSDQGLAYHVSGSYATNYIYPGTFYMVCQTKSQRTVEAIRSMLKELRLITQELITDEELKIAKEGWLNSFVFNFDSIDEIMSRLITYAYYGYPLDFLQKTRAEIEAVTKEDILSVAKKYLKPDQVQILVVGKPDDFDESLSVLGEVSEIDITIPTPKAEIPKATPESIAKGKALLEKVAEKMGGMDRMVALKNIYLKMKLTQVTPMGEMEMDGKATIVYPDRTHMILNTPMGEMTMVLVGDEAWMTSPQGTMPAPTPMKDNLKGGLFRDPATLFKNLNVFSTQYVGETTFNEKSVEELIIAGDVFSYYLYLDKETYLPLGVKYTTVGQQGPTEVVEHFCDYRDAGGLMIPFKTDAYDKDKKASEVVLLDVKSNVEVDMSIFEKK
jgi:zinc protease